jgi:hypothetical protein
VKECEETNCEHRTEKVIVMVTRTTVMGAGLIQVVDGKSLLSFGGGSSHVHTSMQCVLKYAGPAGLSYVGEEMFELLADIREIGTNGAWVNVAHVCNKKTECVISGVNG